MTVPDSVPDAVSRRFAELVIALPADWPGVGKYEVMADDERMYPLARLKWLARFPHDYATWVGAGHTMPWHDPPQPIGPDTKMSGFIYRKPRLWSGSFASLQATETEQVNFMSVVPLYFDEMKYKLERGADALYTLLDKAGVDDIYRSARPSALSRSGLPGVLRRLLIS